MSCPLVTQKNDPVTFEISSTKTLFGGPPISNTSTRDPCKASKYGLTVSLLIPFWTLLRERKQRSGSQVHSNLSCSLFSINLWFHSKAPCLVARVDSTTTSETCFDGIWFFCGFVFTYLDDVVTVKAVDSPLCVTSHPPSAGNRPVHGGVSGLSNSSATMWR